MSEVVDVSHEIETSEGEQAAAPWCPPPPAEPVWPETWNLPPGVVPRQTLREAERLGILTTSAVEIPESGFQPASLDLLLGPTAYRIGSSFLPGDCTVRERLTDLQIDKGIDIRNGGILEPKRPYLIPLMEGLRLPGNVRAFTNPKSSTGRVDIFTRVVTDYSHRFDDIAPGYEGALWLEVFSRSFLVKVHAGMALNQLRFIVEDPSGADAPPALPPSAPETVRIQLRPSPEEPDTGDGDGGSCPSASRRGATAPFSTWPTGTTTRASSGKPSGPPTSSSSNPRSSTSSVPGSRSPSPPSLPPRWCPSTPPAASFAPTTPGFFDPGFGASVPSGLPAVLEVRAHDVPFMLEDGQEVATFRYQKLAGPPDRLYGRDAGSHYGDERQWRFLSKHFRSWGQLPLRF